MEEEVTISKKEYLSLLNDSEKLTALECNGVDNWCGWDDARAEYHANMEVVLKDKV